MQQEIEESKDRGHHQPEMDSGSERDSDRENYDPTNDEIDQGIYGAGMDLDM